MKIKGIETDDLTYSELLALRNYYDGTEYYYLIDAVISERVSCNNNKLKCTTKKKKIFSAKRLKFAHTRYMK